MNSRNASGQFRLQIQAKDPEGTACHPAQRCASFFAPPSSLAIAFSPPPSIGRHEPVNPTSTAHSVSSAQLWNDSMSPGFGSSAMLCLCWDRSLPSLVCPQRFSQSFVFLQSTSHRSVDLRHSRSNPPVLYRAVLYLVASSGLDPSGAFSNSTACHCLNERGQQTGCPATQPRSCGTSDQMAAGPFPYDPSGVWTSHSASNIPPPLTRRHPCRSLVIDAYGRPPLPSRCRRWWPAVHQQPSAPTAYDQKISDLLSLPRHARCLRGSLPRPYVLLHGT